MNLGWGWKNILLRECYKEFDPCALHFDILPWHAAGGTPAEQPPSLL